MNAIRLPGRRSQRNLDSIVRVLALIFAAVNVLMPQYDGRMARVVHSK